MVEFEEGVKLPSKIAEIYRVRNKLRGVIFYLTNQAVNESFGIEDVNILFRSLLKCFPKRCKDSTLFCEALHRSIENYLIGVDADNRSMLNKLPCILAGNIHGMLIGRAVSPAASIYEPDYCLAQIRDVSPIDATLEKFEVLFELLTGRNASDCKFWASTMYLGTINKLMTTVGVQRKFSPAYENKHPRQLVLCYLFIQPNVVDGWESINKITCTPSLKSKNKTLAEDRSPMSRDEWCNVEECGLCPKGPCECRLSTRLSSCVTGSCPVTNEPGLVNPDNLKEPSLQYQEEMW